MKNPCVPVRPALPASKISPLYLQQQYQEKSTQPTNTPTPTPTAKMPQFKLNVNVPTATASSSSPKQPTTQPTSSHEPLSTDYFDSFTEYDAAAYRLSLTRSFLNSVFNEPDSTSSSSSPSSSAKKIPLQLNPSLADDLVAAMKKKTQTIQTRIQRHQIDHSALLAALQVESEEFVRQCELIKKAPSLDSLQ